MAKIDRYNGNLKAFASDATGTERTIFGDTAQSDELDANITADLLRGWGVVGPTFNPTKQDFNGLGFTLGQLIAYLHQQGVPEWNAAQEYYEGSVVTTLAGIYRLKNGGDATVDPDNDNGTNWELAPTRAQVDAKANQATTYTETEVDALIRPVVGEVKLFAGNSSALNTMYVRGWRIADGTDGTPNLTDAFPKFGTFAQKSDTGGAKTVTPAGSVSVSTSVSVSNHTLSVAQMPSHNHNQRISVDSPGMDNLTVPLANQASDTTSGGNTGSAGSSNSHNHGSSASSSGSFSGSNHTNEPQFTYLVPLYFTGVAGTYP